MGQLTQYTAHFCVSCFLDYLKSYLESYCRLPILDFYGSLVTVTLFKSSKSCPCHLIHVLTFSIGSYFCYTFFSYSHSRPFLFDTPPCLLIHGLTFSFTSFSFWYTSLPSHSHPYLLIPVLAFSFPSLPSHSHPYLLILVLSIFFRSEASLQNDFKNFSVIAEIHWFYWFF